MKRSEKTRNPEIQALKIIQRLREEGYCAYYAGGYVRDKILGRESEDIDIVSSAPIEIVQKIFQRTVPIGIHYGVILVCMGNQSFEVSRFRKDGPYLDGRHPSSVEFCNEEEDSHRRDFTINGMLFDPIKGAIIDYVGGREDLEKGLIRAIGNASKRIQEDKLRMLRAIRFACRFSYSIEENTWKAIQEQHKTILEVSAERIREEFSKILTEGHARRGIELLKHSGLLQVILPELLLSRDAKGKDLYHKTLPMLSMLETMQEQNQESPKYKKELAWACLFGYFGDKTKRILQRFKLSKKEQSEILELTESLSRIEEMQIEEIQKESKSTLKRFFRKKSFLNALELYRWHCIVQNKSLEPYQFYREKYAMWQSNLNPKPLLTGEDLIQKGFIPGPQFQILLEYLENAQLEGKIRTKAEAFEYLESLKHSSKYNHKGQNQTKTIV